MNRPSPSTQRHSASAMFSGLASEIRRAAKVWPVRGFFAILDQGLISGSNFLVVILLARWMAPGQYGAYALAFEVLLFLSVMYGALILEPMSVFGPSVYKNDFSAYLGILLRIHCVLSVAIVAGVFAAAGVLEALKPASSLPSALMGVGIASPCLLLFWLARRGFYVHLLPRKAALGACAYSAVLLAGVLVAFKFRALSSLTVFLMMAAGAAVAGPLMLRWFRRHMPAAPRRFRLSDVVRQHWVYGRWALASSLAIWFSAAIYYPLLGSFFSLAETGRFKALMNLASPIGQVFVAVSLLSLPHASRTHHERGGEVSGRLVWKLTGFYVGGTTLYWAALLLMGGPIIRHLYGGKYTAVIVLLPWLALGSIFRIAATAQAIVLRAMRSPALVFVAYSAACAVAVALGVPMSRWWGVRGALFAWVLSSATALMVAMVTVHRKSGQLVAPERISANALALRDEAPMGTQA